MRAVRILIASDKFKGTLSATEVAHAIAAGLPQDDVQVVPIADGGEGTAHLLAQTMAAQPHETQVHDALGAPIRARFWLDEDACAYLEMSAASGLTQIEPARRDPWRASTRGTGELLLAARAAGARRIVMGIGGSATNDGGSGCAQALGYRFVDAAGRELTDIPGDLHAVRSIDASKRIDLPPLQIACDVDNPLLGATGATAVYGAQKGVTPEASATQEARLAHLADLVRAANLPDQRTAAGAGAAGGLGYGLVAFAGGNLENGFELISNFLNIKEKIKSSDIVITGEGRLDAQSFHGKAPVALARLAHAQRVPVVAVCGQCAPEVRDTPALHRLFRQVLTLSAGGDPRGSQQDHGTRLTRMIADARSNWLSLG